MLSNTFDSKKKKKKQKRDMVRIRMKKNALSFEILLFPLHLNGFLDAKLNDS